LDRYAARSENLVPVVPALTLVPGLADEAELLRLRIFRVHLWMQSGNVGPALDEIADLERYPNLSDEVRGILARLAGR
jgi:hypothetical protein